VATAPGAERDGKTPWSAQEFYATGELDWQEFYARWREFGVGKETCLEIGCGAGRITRSLAGSFRRVIAIDVSPHMIACAERAIDRATVDFQVTSGLAVPRPDCSVQAVFSTHVLQHLDDSEVVIAYFREFFRVLEPGGTIMVHLPLCEWPSEGRIARLLNIVFTVATAISTRLAWCKRLAKVKFMRNTAVRAKLLYSALSEIGFRGIEFRTFAISRNGALYSFVLARK
jgi:ubiquinone/menaquinone biosynthesis C-methylase UbiE